MFNGIPKTIGLVPNSTKPKAIEMIPQVVHALESLGFQHMVDIEVQEQLKDVKTTFETVKQMSEIADLLIVFGGDGTYLHTARATAGSAIPIMGVNLGRLGFLTEIEIHELDWALKQLSLGDYHIDERIMLEVKIFRDHEQVLTAVGLNDVTISNAGMIQMVELEIFIDNEFLNFYPADGLIVATPTGSTAYSLSAGGPIVNPFSRALVITPICPHTLYSRSIVLSEEEVVKVTMRSPHRHCVLAVDGEIIWNFEQTDSIEIVKAQKVVRSVRMPGHTFYKILRDRMRGDRV